MNVCGLVPVYNHGRTVAAVVSALREHGLPCVLVDDASDAGCAAELDRLAAGEGVELVRHAENQGKGAAVISGLRRAQALGYTHALQIDADAQHDTGAIEVLLRHARAAPDAVIIGSARFDASVPRVRYYGRYLTHVWVWINTLSRRIEDAMCGLRVYPLAPVLRLLERVRVGRRMDFDVEVLVRLDWDGVPAVNVPVNVGYPADGVSHFRPWRDNLLISAMHARLFFGMLLRAPRLLRRHFAGTG